MGRLRRLFKVCELLFFFEKAEVSLIEDLLPDLDTALGLLLLCPHVTMSELLSSQVALLNTDVWRLLHQCA